MYVSKTLKKIPIKNPLLPYPATPPFTIKKVNKPLTTFSPMNVSDSQPSGGKSGPIGKMTSGVQNLGRNTVNKLKDVNDKIK